MLIRLLKLLNTKINDATLATGRISTGAQDVNKGVQNVSSAIDGINAKLQSTDTSNIEAKVASLTKAKTTPKLIKSTTKSKFQLNNRRKNNNSMGR